MIQEKYKGKDKLGGKKKTEICRNHHMVKGSMEYRY